MGQLSSHIVYLYKAYYRHRHIPAVKWCRWPVAPPPSSGKEEKSGDGFRVARGLQGCGRFLGSTQPRDDPLLPLKPIAILPSCG